MIWDIFNHYTDRFIAKFILLGKLSDVLNLTYVLNLNNMLSVINKHIDIDYFQFNSGILSTIELYYPIFFTRLVSNFKEDVGTCFAIHANMTKSTKTRRHQKT